MFRSRIWCILVGMTKPLDKLGKPISVHDYIVYGHALGRCAGLRVGRVLAVIESKQQSAFDSGWKLTVIGVEDDWASQEVKLCSRKGTLMFPNRTVVVDSTNLPKNYLKMLNSYTDP
jgi:hypothetical protein